MMSINFLKLSNMPKLLIVLPQIHLKFGNKMKLNNGRQVNTIFQKCKTSAPSKISIKILISLLQNGTNLLKH